MYKFNFILFLIISLSSQSFWVSTNVRDYLSIVRPEYNKEFQVNCSNLNIDQVTGLAFKVPYVGVYSREGYSFNDRLALICLKPEILMQVLPNNIKNLLNKEFGFDIFKNLNKLDINGLVIAFGQLLDQNKKPKDDIYNLVYHSFAGSWPVHRDNNSMKYYNVNIQSGLFNPFGVTEIPVKNHGISFSKFGQYKVVYHHPQALSPNNLRFKVDLSNNYSSFWSIAFSLDKKHLVISNILLANNEKAENFLRNIFVNSKSLTDLAQVACSFIVGAKWLTDQDKKILESVVTAIVNS